MAIYKKDRYWYNDDMKRLTVISILFLFIILFPFSLPNQQPSTADPPDDRKEEQEFLNLFEDNPVDESEDEEDDWYGQDFFPRKLFQKRLESLTNAETIIWSFRMAEPDSFL